MKSKALSFLKITSPILFWLFVWDIFSLIVDHSYFLPSVLETLRALYLIVFDVKFIGIVLSTLLRVLTGLFLGIVIGALLAFLSYKIKPLRLFISPLMTVIKSTPVATGIIILWIALSADALAVVIALLMVSPIVWQNVLDGFSSLSPALIETSEIYGFSVRSKIKYLLFPPLFRYFIPAVITSVGLAWKAEIAAEIIAYTKNSIGYYINDAKNFYESDKVFAWTLIIIIMSILLEKVTKYLTSRCKV